MRRILAAAALALATIVPAASLELRHQQTLECRGEACWPYPPDPGFTAPAPNLTIGTCDREGRCTPAKTNHQPLWLDGGVLTDKGEISTAPSYAPRR